MTDIRPGRSPAGSPPAAEAVFSSAGRGWRNLEAEFLRIPAGLTYVPAASSHRLGIHFGRSVHADCRCDGRRHRRVQKHGDIDVIPAGLDGSWQDDADCSLLRLRLSPALMREAAADLGGSPAEGLLDPRFHLRDAKLEAIGWAIKAEIEAELPSNRLYADSLGVALAVRLVELSREPRPIGVRAGQGLSPRQRRLLADYIDTHLDRALGLIDLAEVAGLSVSHLKTLFRNSFGMPVHRYVLHRRIEEARTLLLAGDKPISQVALDVGFADQSHMANWTRRILGLSPRDIVRMRP
jgi:AraC family transcriptional regulator